jgi:nicotinamidase-related amidase
MYKPRWRAFYNTLLEKHLHNLDVNTVVVCGCNFPNCPRTTIYEASERDFRIILAKDAQNANKSDLVEIWQTIKKDRQKHMHMLKEALEKEIHA